MWAISLDLNARQSDSPSMLMAFRRGAAEGHGEPKVTQYPLKDGVFKDVHMLGPMPEQQWLWSFSIYRNGSNRLKPLT